MWDPGAILVVVYGGCEGFAGAGVFYGGVIRSVGSGG
jgi:hypothetical protein